MNWQRDKGLAALPWQVEDLRQLETDELFDRLGELGVPLVPTQFAAAVDEVESPEELAELYTEEGTSSQTEDQIYLLLFELWRRLYPEQHTLSLFCDELDHRINLYDLDAMDTGEGVQDALANLQDVLDENNDVGVDPHEAIDLLSCHLANDLSSFLYDFISDQIDSENTLYAAELIEGFAPYMEEDPWFNFLQVRLWALSDEERANEAVTHLLDQTDDDLELLLEIVTFLAGAGDHDLFHRALHTTLGQIETEEDLLDLINACAHYYRCIDEEKKEMLAEALLAARTGIPSDAPYKQGDPAVEEFLRQVSS